MTNTKTRETLLALFAILMTVFLTGVAAAHGVAEGDKGFIEQTSGPQIGPFLYSRSE